MNLDALRGKAVATAEEVAPLLDGMSARSVYRAMDRGEVPEWRCGRRRYVAVPALLKMLGADNADDPAGTGSSESSAGSDGEGARRGV